MTKIEMEIAKMLVGVSGGATSGRIANLMADMDARGITDPSAYDIEECADEKTGRRYGDAKCRKGFAVKLGHTTYAYQVWAVLKPEHRTEG